jgi:capsule polysaccharide export protein KpsE/RkpR
MMLQIHDTGREEPEPVPNIPLWVYRARLLWQRRGLLFRVAAISMLISLGIAFAIPKRYKSYARIMPPEQQGAGAMMLAALAGRGGNLGALGAMAGDLYGRSGSALFTGLLRSGTVAGRLIDRFDLQQVYHQRFRIDAAKRLARNTSITDDKKSGMITIEVEDTDSARARDVAQAYLDELNKLVTQTSTSAARSERIFIEQRLKSVQKDLETAQLELGEFSSRNTTIDLKEQTRALVDVSARIQGELLVQQSGLQSLRQVYGESNVRVREAEARIATLQHELNNMAGTSPATTHRLASTSGSSVIAKASTSADSASDNSSEIDPAELYPRLRELPRLAVPYADLYRRVKVQESVYELLTQQYEMARIGEAKDIPVVSVVDAPGLPEKKSFPPRLLLTLILTTTCLATTSLLILLSDAWSSTDNDDPAKALGAEVLSALMNRIHAIPSLRTARRRGVL